MRRTTNSLSRLQNRNGCGYTSELGLLKEKLGLLEGAGFGFRLGFGPRGAGINSCYRLSCPRTNNRRLTRLASLVFTGHLHWNRKQPFFGRSLAVRLSLRVSWRCDPRSLPGRGWGRRRTRLYRCLGFWPASSCRLGSC